MRIKNKKIEFEAGCFSKYVNLLPWVTICANKNTPKWQDWAVEIGWLMFAVGFRVRNF